MFRRLIRPNSVLCRRRFLRSAGRSSVETDAIAVEEDIDLTKPHIVVCKNGAIACWHPEEPFPYEHTKPIDLQQLKKESTTKVSSVLKDDVVLESERNRLRRGPASCELKEIFYTSKNEWYTRTREDRLYALSAPRPRRK
uniref:Large ribosomal subunit protein mL42 n=1 Tax=Ascaris lumbricoides TaxID=6252 RepID=A0A0M3HZD2_ASCLU